MLKKSWLVLGIFVVPLVVGSLFFNMWIEKQVERGKGTDVMPTPEAQKKEPETVLKKKAPSNGEVKRTTIVVRGREYLESVFYRGGEEMGRVKEFSNGTFETTGEMPNGRVKFKDEYAKTYGEEFYQDGKRHGTANTYFSDGRIQSVAEYRFGRLIWKKEYYPGGALRFEVDYSHARDYDSDEVGIGKLYFSNGVLKYEWNLTDRDSRGFKKSYNQDGTLRAATYFDAQGNVVQTP